MCAFFYQCRCVFGAVMKEIFKPVCALILLTSSAYSGVAKYRDPQYFVKRRREGQLYGFGYNISSSDLSTRITAGPTYPRNVFLKNEMQLSTSKQTETNLNFTQRTTVRQHRL